MEIHHKRYEFYCVLNTFANFTTLRRMYQAYGSAMGLFSLIKRIACSADTPWAIRMHAAMATPRWRPLEQCVSTTPPLPITFNAASAPLWSALIGMGNNGESNVGSNRLFKGGKKSSPTGGN